MRALRCIGLGVIFLLSVVISDISARALADYAVLVHRYGAVRVSAESLKVTDAVRQRLVISNGDVLGDSDATMLGGIWAISAFVLTFGLTVALYFSLKPLIPWALPDRL